MTHRTLFQILVELMVVNIVFFNRFVNEWNGLPNHIRESNSIATFKKNVTLASLLRPGFYGPTVVVLLGFHCIFLKNLFT